MDPEIKGLLVFRDLARTGSFSETAKIWGLSQPTISQIVGKLESSIGLVLLERGTAGTRPTSVGERMLDRVHEIHDAYHAFLIAIDNLARRMDRTVRVGFDQSWFGQNMAAMVSNAIPPDGVVHETCTIQDDWSDGLVSFRYDVVLASRFLRTGLTHGIQEAVIRHENGITVAWNPEFHTFDIARFRFPDILRTSVLLPDPKGVAGFSSLVPVWCKHAYGAQPAQTVVFESEIAAATAAAAGLGVMLGPGDLMARLGDGWSNLAHVRTFEFLLPEALTFGIYCRSDEPSKDVYEVAARLGRLARRHFGQA